MREFSKESEGMENSDPKDFCYISGPVTGHPDYLERFAAAEALLTQKGYHIVNPVKVNAMLPTDTSYEAYMHMSFAMMDLCSTIILLSGWEESSGAKRELKYAEEKGMNVLYFDGGKIYDKGTAD